MIGVTYVWDNVYRSNGVQSGCSEIFFYLPCIWLEKWLFLSDLNKQILAKLSIATQPHVESHLLAALVVIILVLLILQSNEAQLNLK